MTDLAELRRHLVERASWGDSTAQACLGLVDRLDAMEAGAPACPHAVEGGSGWCAVAEAAGRGWTEARAEAGQAVARSDRLAADLRRSDLDRERQRIKAADARRDAATVSELLRQAHTIVVDVATATSGPTDQQRDQARRLAEEVAKHIEVPDHQPLTR